jgi:aspartate kinase
MKFGGSSLADATQLEKVVRIVEGRCARGAIPAVVCSAHKGVTDALIQCTRDALEGRPDTTPVVDRQSRIASAVGLDPAELTPFFDELDQILQGIALLKEVSPRILDLVQSFGERMSVRTVAGALRTGGRPAQAFDAFDLGFVTDGHFGRARPLPGTEADMRAAYRARVPEAVVPVITGFVGRTREGDITTVGRNGSDFSATVFAAALGADECEIWTDTDGVMTADPNLCPAARNIPELSFAEASELALYGGRVLHPSTLVPAIRKNIPVRVLNTNHPDHPGTVITESGGASGPVTSIAYKRGQTVLTISSSSMLGQPGFLARVFDVLGRAEVDIDMISTSEVTVSMTTSSARGIEQARPELETHGRVKVTRERALVCIVGGRLRDEPGVAATVFGALHHAGVNVEMISHGANTINLSLSVRDEDVAAAVPALHQALFEGA